MITIYKYSIKGLAMLPDNAKMLTAAFQESQLRVWAKVDTDSPVVPYRFKVFGTGWDATDLTPEDTFLATIFEDQFVWHVFYNKEV